MAYSHYNYGAPPSYDYYEDDSTLPQLLVHPDDPDQNMHIDPSLQRISPAAHLSSPWTPPQPVQSFLKDPQRTAFFNAPASQAFRNPTMMYPVATFPPPSQRQGSPFSYHEPSSTCSSALSPPGESEFVYENVPSTPPDFPAISPFSAATPFEPHWNLQSQLYGMAPPREVCVNPLEVNPAQGTPIDFFESENSGLDILPLQSGFSLQSHSSYFDVELPGQPAPAE